MRQVGCNLDAAQVGKWLLEYVCSCRTVGGRANSQGNKQYQESGERESSSVQLFDGLVDFLLISAHKVILDVFECVFDIFFVSSCDVVYVGNLQTKAPRNKSSRTRIVQPLHELNAR